MKKRQRPVPDLKQQRGINGAWSRPGDTVIGVDEVGRGACAGPIAVVGVLAYRDWTHDLAHDSKTLTSNQREKGCAEFLGSGPDPKGIQVVLIASFEADQIDVSNVDVANRELTALVSATLYKIKPSPVCLDGEMLPYIRGVPHEDLFNIIDADALLPVTGAASVIAKVQRDAWMDIYHESHPHYGWEMNKGYLTMGHVSGIKEKGLCALHRFSYSRIREFMLPSDRCRYRPRVPEMRAWTRFLLR